MLVKMLTIMDGPLDKNCYGLEITQYRILTNNILVVDTNMLMNFELVNFTYANSNHCISSYMINIAQKSTMQCPGHGILQF